MDAWRTSIVDARDGHIRLRGYDVPALMTGRTFTDTIFLLHQSRLPSTAERALLDAVLTGVADHGSGAPSCATARLAISGNRQSISAAVAAGLLAVGDDHGGAGLGCMELIAEGVALMKTEGLSIADAAARVVAQARQAKRRLPGFGHRVHSTDPRTAILFGLAEQGGIAGDGVAS
jgi:citrate synthase